MLIDTHAHLNFEVFAKDYKIVIERALKIGVFKIINVGSDLQTSLKAIQIAEEFDNCYASISLHPIHVDQIRDLRQEIEGLKRLAQHPKVVAIGETGLDYFHNKSTKEEQKKLFIALLNLASKLDLAVIIHSRDSFKDTLEILSSTLNSPPTLLRRRNRSSDLPASERSGSRPYVGKLSSLCGVVHCFSGNLQQAQEILDLGFFLSFTGNITYNLTAEREEMLKKVPLERMMVETDCPFMAPEPYRGKRNEPAYVIEVAKKIAEIKGISLEEVGEVTTKNAIKLFKLI